KTGFDAMKANGFYEKPQFAGREKAIESLTYTPAGDLTRGIRVGGFPQIRKEISNAMEGIFFGKMTVQAGLDQAVDRGNAIIRRFEKTYAGQTLN
ncbi:MAG TPA: glycerol 3-phosphate ABC transporter, partial [Phyllobacterium sp.]|nr:glycerol 3-phosphate ABC transporter [Phyllobacterium sp.]